MIDEELEKELQEIRDLVDDNNKLLHKIHRKSQLHMVMSAFYWVFIIGATIGAFVFIKPYIDGIMNVYSSFGGTEQSSTQGFNLKGIIDQYVNEYKGQ